MAFQTTPERGVVDELRHHLCAALEAVSWPNTDPVEVFRGWKDNDEFSAPSFTVLMGDPNRESMAPEEERRELSDVDGDGDDEIVVYWRRKAITVDMTIDLYTATKTERAGMVPLVAQLFDPTPNDQEHRPPTDGLSVTLDKHFDAEARLDVQGPSTLDAEGVQGGLFRLQWTITARTYELTRSWYEQATFSNSTEAQR